MRHGFLVKENAEEETKEVKTITGVNRLNPTPPKGVTGCSIVVDVVNGKLKPKTVPV
jgi:hypothetical protein